MLDPKSGGGNGQDESEYLILESKDASKGSGASWKTQELAKAQELAGRLRSSCYPKQEQFGQ